MSRRLSIEKFTGTDGAPPLHGESLAESVRCDKVTPLLVQGGAIDTSLAADGPRIEVPELPIAPLVEVGDELIPSPGDSVIGLVLDVPPGERHGVPDLIGDDRIGQHCTPALEQDPTELDFGDIYDVVDVNSPLAPNPSAVKTQPQAQAPNIPDVTSGRRSLTPNMPFEPLR